MQNLGDVLARHKHAAVLDADLVVLGAGMAGFTAAARAAELGLRVLLVEKSETPGGSAILSAGFVWTVSSLEALVEQDPGGDDALGRLLVDNFPDRVAWLRSLGIRVGPEVSILAGQGHQIDMNEYFARCLALVTAADGHVLPGVSSVEPLTVEGRFAGMLARRAGEEAVLCAPTVCLSTGGFQADRELVRRYITSDDDRLALRSNRESTGDGLRFGVELGAALTTESMGAFYGHLFPSPMPTHEPSPSDYTMLSQFHSERAVLLDRRGRRFTDESRMDHENALAVVETEGSTAYLVVDERVRREAVLPAFAPGLEAGVDKMAHAGSLGARYASTATIAALGDAMGEWGVPARVAVSSLERFNDAVRHGEGHSLRPPRRRLQQPLDEPPFGVLEVVAAITFTYGGLRCDDACRVLDERSDPIPGVLAAGADMGAVYVRGYTGGLARGLVFGYRAAETAASALAAG